MQPWEKSYEKWIKTESSDWYTNAVASAPPLVGVALEVVRLCNGTRGQVSLDTLVNPNSEAATIYTNFIIPRLADQLGPDHMLTRAAIAEGAVHRIDDASCLVAIEILCQTFPLDPRLHRRSTVNLAYALFRAGRLEQALKIIENFEPIGQLACDSWTGIADIAATIYGRLGLWDRALKKLQPWYLLNQN